MAPQGLNRRQLLRGSAVMAGGVGLAAAGAAPASAEVPDTAPGDPAEQYTRWSHGPNPTGRDDYFPLCVWLQSPENAGRYAEIGINGFVGLWQGPTEDQLATLKQFGMRTICDQNDVGLAHRDDPIIMGWLQQDEPDNAQPDGNGGYGPPVEPSEIIQRYENMRAQDPTRPVYLGLGQGVANDTWEGRGKGLPWDDYYDYVHGGDITAFDVYPVASGAGPLWYPAKGIDRLHMWGDRYGKIVWNDIETTNISSTNYPTPAQVISEVWMSIIHGSRGITYFCHSFTPEFDETGLLDEPEMRAAVGELNRQITGLAPVLNSPTLVGVTEVETSDPVAPVDVLVKSRRGYTYVLAAGMRDANVTATFRIDSGYIADGAPVTVLGENRTVASRNGSFSDDFGPYDIHLYKVSRG